jgi:uncharacterized caspase-like protein
MSYHFLGIGVAVALSSWASMSAALAEGRVALVMGNSAYQSVPALPNAANDAKAVAEFLSSAGFEVVSAPDLTQSSMRRAIGEFADKISSKGRDTVAAVYYAGHGVQVDGYNYLVPIDAQVVRESDVPLQGVRLDDLMNALAAVPSKMRIVMLDACRNNPFSEINKVGGRGLAIVDAPAGSIVSYSTSPGSEALDGDGANSPYTTAFLSVAKEPGLPIEQAFKRMRLAVNDATRHQQLPWESSSVTTEFSFIPGQGGGATAARPAATPVSVTGAGGAHAATRSLESWKKELQRKPAREAYDVVIKDNSVEAYQAYVSLFPAQAGELRVREVLDRRLVMVAWYTAVTVNMPASYRTFLSSYGKTDLGGTAQRLLDRALNRSLVADTQVANTCPCSLPTQTKPQEKQEKQERRASHPTTTTKHKSTGNDYDDDPPVHRTVNQPPNIPIEIPIGIGIGIGGGMGGMGGMGGGREGGGGMKQPPMGGGGYNRGHNY